MFVSAAQGSLFVPDDVAPFAGSCPRCGADVLSITMVADGHEEVVDPVEVLPEHLCPSCDQVRGRGHARSGCTRCGDTGMLGEPFPLRGIRVDEVGRGRPFTGKRSDGEAVHVLHSCAVG